MSKLFLKSLAGILFAVAGYFLGSWIIDIMKDKGVLITADNWAVLIVGLPVILGVIGFNIVDFYFFYRNSNNG